MQKIVPHLWYDTQAKEAANFYVDVFKDGAVKKVTQLHNTPSGDVDMVIMELFGQRFEMISAGPYFKFTPAISMFVTCKTKEEVAEYWNRLSDGGTVMMPLGSYPFSESFGWCADKYGLSWQIFYAGDQPVTQRITPFFLFVGDALGKAEAAINRYVSIFPDAHVDLLQRHPEGSPTDKAGTVLQGHFTLAGQKFIAMDSGAGHKFGFNEAVSLMVRCKDQEEIDYYWERLSAVPEAEQCGWLKDEFGVSWQIVPEEMDEMMTSDDAAARQRVTEAFLKMKKFDLAALRRAFNGS